jgi:hypothetical protein
MAGSYYDVLGVSSTATDAELKSAFVTLARRHHPDFHEAADPRVRAAHERAMQAVNEAWTVLGDKGRRQVYDSERRLRGGGGGDTARGRWEAGRTATAEDAARKAWQPYDDDDSDDIDADSAQFSLTHDRPITPALVPRLLTIAPVLLGAGGFVLIVVGLFLSLGRVAAVGAAAVLAALPLLLAAPLYALAKSQDDGTWGPRRNSSSSRRGGR